MSTGVLDIDGNIITPGDQIEYCGSNAPHLENNKFTVAHLENNIVYGWMLWTTDGNWCSPGHVRVIPKRQTPRECTCDFSKLQWMLGCRCGYFTWEQQQKEGP